MMVAVDADFAAAVNLIDARVRFQEYSMAMRSAAWIPVGQGTRQVFRKMEVQAAAALGIELLHSYADSENGRLPFQDAAHKHPVALLAALGHGLHGRMRGE